MRRIGELREYIRKHGLGESRDAVDDVEAFIDKLGIAALEGRGTLREVVEAMKSYSLLSGDALIAVTARRYGISTMVTFDEDF